MWNDRCRWVRHRLPLLAGDDLLGAERRRAQRHLLGCLPCQHRLEELRVALGVLQVAAAETPVRSGRPSLWPEVSRLVREERHATLSSRSWGVSWSNAGFWSGLAVAAVLIVAVSLIHRPGPGRDPLAQSLQTTSVTPPAPKLASTPVLKPAPLKVSEFVRPVASRPAPVLVQNAVTKASAVVEAAPSARHEDAPDRTPPAPSEPQPTH